jgi:transketolase
VYCYSEQLLRELSVKAQQFRVQVLSMVFKAQSGHLGGSFSVAEILTCLYSHHLRIDPARPDWPGRDRFLLSKGHAAPMLYVNLAARGYFPDDELKTFRCLNSRLAGHPERMRTPGVDMGSGPLGHGISVGVGMALAARLDNRTWRTYVLVGDGEMQAGICWEGVMAAGKYKLDNLTAIMDCNDVQLDGRVQDIMPLEPVCEKWRAFGWHILEIDGHNVRQILEALDVTRNIHARPTVIVAHTTKGKGVSFMENQSAWHGKPPNREQYEQALAELKARLPND